MELLSSCNTYILLYFYWFDEAMLSKSKVLQTWFQNGKNRNVLFPDKKNSGKNVKWNNKEMA